MKPRIYADFQNLDDDNRILLNTRGTLQDLARLGIPLSEGLQLTLYTDDADEAGRPDDLLVDGLARCVAGTSWVAEVDWDSLRHASDGMSAAEVNGHPTAAAPNVRVE